MNLRELWERHVVSNIPVHSAKINDRSMFPTYQPGEYVWCSRVFRRRKLKSGDVVYFLYQYGPHESWKFFIKRITRVDRNENGVFLFVEGDNAEHSYDSRQFGAIPVQWVRAYVLNQRPKK